MPRSRDGISGFSHLQTKRNECECHEVASMKVLVSQTRYQTRQSNGMRWCVDSFRSLLQKLVHLPPQKSIPYRFNLLKNAVVDDALLDGFVKKLRKGIPLWGIVSQPQDFLDADYGVEKGNRCEGVSVPRVQH